LPTHPYLLLTYPFPDDIHLEPHHRVNVILLQYKFPADVGLLPFPPLTPLPPFTYIAIDVTIVPIVTPSDPPSSVPLDPESSTRFIHKVHNEAAIISHLNSSHLLLLPFTLDPFGVFSYFAQEFLLLSSSHHPPTPKPPWTDNCLSKSPNADPHPAAFSSFQLATSSFIPSHLFSHIHVAWNDSHSNDSF
jgi:hypothetical protein